MPKRAITEQRETYIAEAVRAIQAKERKPYNKAALLAFPDVKEHSRQSMSSRLRYNPVIQAEIKKRLEAPKESRNWWAKYERPEDSPLAAEVWAERRRIFTPEWIFESMLKYDSHGLPAVVTYNFGNRKTDSEPLKDYKIVGIIFLQNRDGSIRPITLDPFTEVAEYFPTRTPEDLEAMDALEMAFNPKKVVLCYIGNDGWPRYNTKTPEDLAAAEKIAIGLSDDIARHPW